jgi:hypothetical protein
MSDSNAVAALLGGSCLLILLVMVAIAVVPAVFYLLTMQKALNLAGREHRNMEPGLVWLSFIPFFGIVWQFFVVKHVSDAVKNWAAANDREVGDGGWNIGLAGCILFCCSWIPLLGPLAAIGGLVCHIIWWIKVADFNKMMA